MNERQRTVLGVAVVALILVGLFFVPWRLEPTDEIEWAPAYRQPVSHLRSYASERHDTSYAYRKGEIAVDVLVLQILAIGVMGGVAFAVTGDDQD